MAKRELPTAAYVRSILHYDPLTGVFTWRERPREHFKTLNSWSAWNARYAGTIAGNMRPDGYWQISINRHRYLSHRLAWLIETGEWPRVEIDHRDMDHGNNRWRNLREATRSQNEANKCAHSDNKSGLKGISWHKQTGKWRVRIQAGGEEIFLGYFAEDRLNDAESAYADAAERFHGEFSRVA